jgi:hypothetical protein
MVHDNGTLLCKILPCALCRAPVAHDKLPISRSVWKMVLFQFLIKGALLRWTPPPCGGMQYMAIFGNDQ